MSWLWHRYGWAELGACDLGVEETVQGLKDVMARDPEASGASLPTTGTHWPLGSNVRFVTIRTTNQEHLPFPSVEAACRFGDLAGLRAHRLDLLRRSLTIAETLSDVRGQAKLAPPKTTAARRQVALPKFLSEELARHLAQWLPGVDGFVFTAPKGGPLRRTNFRRRAWLSAVRSSVGEPLRVHDLRHTHAAMLIAQGEHPKVNQLRLGHS